ncbi:MAG: cellulose synthase subunit BcsC-related outer membrane protein, partial [Thermodesulfobacteriota bacterium]
SKVNDQEAKKIKSQIYLKKADSAYEKKDYAEAENYLQKLLVLEPENASAKSHLAWTLYNQSNFDAALPLFIDAFEKQKKPEIAEAIIYSYEKSGRRKAALDFSREIARSKNESLREVSANYFFAEDMPISAASVHTGPETPYYNADKPWLESSPFFRHKSGTSGFSRLNEASIPLSLLHPFGSANNIRFSFITQWLSSGDSPSSPFAGNFAPGETQERDLIDSLWVFTPEIGFEREGYTKYSFSVGVTPLNGTVYPVPTFFAEARRRGWNVNIHQNSVRESILSYVGQEDPYGSREWGRVLKTGVNAEATFVPLSFYWITLSGGYDYYWGNNVKQNNGIHGTISFGKTFDKNIGNISLGVFVAGQHFQRNSDFFTFGHGGYFSPELLVIAGPTVSFETKPHETFWLSGQGSVGFLYFRTEDAPFFPLRSDKSDGEFGGDSSSQLGFSGKIEGLKLLTPHFAGGLFSSINKSADFTEWSGGLTLRYYFDSRFRLLPQQRNEAWSLR